MKKILLLFLAAAMALLFAACSPGESLGPPVQTMAVREASENGSDATEHAENKALLVYFSPANSDTVDAISSVTLRTGDVSSLERLAQMIHEHVETDIAMIVPAEAYPLCVLASPKCIAALVVLCLRTTNDKGTWSSEHHAQLLISTYRWRWAGLLVF